MFMFGYHSFDPWPYDDFKLLYLCLWMCFSAVSWARTARTMSSGRNFWAHGFTTSHRIHMYSFNLLYIVHIFLELIIDSPYIFHIFQYVPTYFNIFQYIPIHSIHSIHSNHSNHPICQVHPIPQLPGAAEGAAAQYTARAKQSHWPMGFTIDVSYVQI